MIPLSWYIILSAALFTIGVVGVLTRRNIFIILMSIELMLNAANINLVAFSHYLQNLTGQVFTMFVITVAAAEAAVALAIIILLVRNRGTVYVDEFNIMKG
jgi:NADH-quinone oxidoreductase subunit K